MSETDNIRRTKILRSLAETYGRKLQKDTVKMMAKALREVDTGRLEKAADRWMQTRRWMPTVAELRAVAWGYDPDEADLTRLESPAHRMLKSKVWRWLEKHKRRIYEEGGFDVDYDQDDVNEALKALGHQPGEVSEHEV